MLIITDGMLEKLQILMAVSSLDIKDNKRNCFLTKVSFQNIHVRSI